MPPTLNSGKGLYIKIYGNLRFFVVVFLVIFGLKMASQRPGRYLITFLELVAPSWLNMSPWRAMATPFVPKMIDIFADFRKRRAPSHVCSISFQKMFFFPQEVTP